MKQRFALALIALFTIGFVGCVDLTGGNGNDNGNGNGNDNGNDNGGDVNTNGMDNGNDNGDDVDTNGMDNGNDNGGDDNGNDNGDDNSNDNGGDDGMTGGDATAGEAKFAANCSVCHGADGSGGAVVAGSIRGSDGDDVNGAFTTVAGHPTPDLSDEDIADIVAFLADA
ncbi:MAG: c-type cytochrome [Phycisphaerales bacterium]|nr:c-type cytochrome [Phycisphaerales bacterium]